MVTTAERRCIIGLEVLRRVRLSARIFFGYLPEMLGGSRVRATLVGPPDVPAIFDSDGDFPGPRNVLLTLSRTGRMEETSNRALQLLDRLMDRAGVDIEAFKRVANICDGEEGP